MINTVYNTGMRTPESMFIEISYPWEIRQGMIRVRSCAFVGCHFADVSIVGDAAMIQKFKTEVTLSVPTTMAELEAQQGGQDSGEPQ